MSQTATKHVLQIDGWHPTRTNQFVERHWAVGRRLKKADQKTVLYSAIAAGIPKAKAKRLVTLTIILKKGQRRPDVDAYDKSLLDALVAAGLLVDDGPKWCARGDTHYCRATQIATIIELEDVV